MKKLYKTPALVEDDFQLEKNLLSSGTQSTGSTSGADMDIEDITDLW